MCLTGFLAELLCSVVESTEEVDEITTIVEEIKESVSGVDELENLDNDNNSSSNVDVSKRNGGSDHQTDEKSVIVKNIVSAAIQANPTVSAIKNTLGAVKDYRDGEEISDIVVDRAAQMVEDQVPKVVLDQAKTELKNGIEKTCE